MANRDVPLDGVVFFHHLSNNRVAFSIDLQEWGCKFSDLGVSRDSKWENSRLKNQKVVVY